jgi:HK97 family phage prohead protease
MKHCTVNGITCAIEHQAGTVVPIQTPKGEVFRPFSVDYGFVHAVDKTPMQIMGHDGDLLDSYVGLHPRMKRVTIVNQMFHEGDKAGMPDECKAMIGFRTMSEAVRCYQQHTAPGMYGGCATMSVSAFRDHLKAHHESGSKEPVVFPVDEKSVKGMPWFTPTQKTDEEDVDELDDDVKAAVVLATKALAEPLSAGFNKLALAHPISVMPRNAFFRMRKAAGGVWRGWMEDEGWTWLALRSKDGTIALFLDRDPKTGAVKGAPIICPRAKPKDDDEATDEDLDDEEDDKPIDPKEEAPKSIPPENPDPDDVEPPSKPATEAALPMPALATTQAHAVTDPGQGGTPGGAVQPKETHHAFRELLRHLAAAALLLPLASAPELAEHKDVLRAFALGTPAALPGGQAPAAQVSRSAGGAVPDPARAEPRSLVEPRALALHVRKDAGSLREKERVAVFIASTDAVDSYGEVVDQEGWDFSRFQDNPVILFAHDSRSLPVGKALKWYVETNDKGRKQLVIEVYFSKINPFAEMVWQMILEDTLRACSVGFMPGGIETREIDGKERIVLVRNCLFELSICPVPANPEAVLRLEENVLGKIASSLEQRMGAMFADLEPQARSAIDGIHNELGRIKATMEALIARAAAPLAPALTPRAPEPAPPVPAAAPPAPPAAPAPVTLDAGADEALKVAIPFKHFPLSKADSWDAGAARARLRKFCSSDGSGDLDKINVAMYGSCFAVRDGDPKLLESYKLPHTDVVSGKLTTVWGGVRAAGNVLMGGQGGIKLSPADMAAAKNHVGKHYKEFTEVPPWEQEDAAALFIVLAARSNLTDKDKAMRLTHRTTDSSLLTKLREQGSVLILVSDPANAADQIELTLELPTVQRHLDAVEKKAAALATDLETAQTAKAKAESDLAKKAEEHAGVLTELTKLELGSITGVEPYQITPHEASTLAALRATNPTHYKDLVAAAQGRYKTGHDAAQAAARLKAGAGGGGNGGGQGGGASGDNTDPTERSLPTRAPDPTPRTGAADDPGMGGAWEELEAAVEKQR